MGKNLPLSFAIILSQLLIFCLFLLFLSSCTPSLQFNFLLLILKEFVHLCDKSKSSYGFILPVQVDTSSMGLKTDPKTTFNTLTFVGSSHSSPSLGYSSYSLTSPASESLWLHVSMVSLLSSNHCITHITSTFAIGLCPLWPPLPTRPTL